MAEAGNNLVASYKLRCQCMKRRLAHISAFNRNSNGIQGLERTLILRAAFAPLWKSDVVFWFSAQRNQHISHLLRVEWTVPVFTPPSLQKQTEMKACLLALPILCFTGAVQLSATTSKLNTWVFHFWIGSPGFWDHAVSVLLGLVHAYSTMMEWSARKQVKITSTQFY